MLGGATTVRFAVAVLPVPPLVEETAPLVLVNVAAAVPVMLTTTVQELAAAIDPPLELIEVPPAVAEVVPPQELVSPLGVATISPAGSASEKATPVSASVFAAGFVIVKVRVEVPLSGMDVGENALAMLGGATTV